MYGYCYSERVSCVHMTILWEAFSFLSTPFVRLTRPKPHRYVIAIAVFILLFAQCMSHESTTDKQSDNVVPIHKEQQLNRSNVPKASPDAWVAISKRQSPTKVSNSSAPSQMSKNYGSTGVPTSHGHQGKSIPFRSNGSSSSILTTFPSSSSTKFATTNRKQQPSTDETSSTNNVLILIQTKKNIQLHSVRDQFQQFTDMFGITLANITIDFDAIDGK